MVALARDGGGAVRASPAVAVPRWSGGRWGVLRAGAVEKLCQRRGRRRAAGGQKERAEQLL
uniref:Uncharacterized protein n=1 Tax=Arundo donax TaxID=35708 RepID=A0A0A9AY81_ARUDO